MAWVQNITFLLVQSEHHHKEGELTSEYNVAFRCCGPGVSDLSLLHFYELETLTLCLGAACPSSNSDYITGFFNATTTAILLESIWLETWEKIFEQALVLHRYYVRQGWCLSPEDENQAVDNPSCTERIKHDDCRDRILTDIAAATAGNFVSYLKDRPWNHRDELFLHVFYGGGTFIANVPNPTVWNATRWMKQLQQRTSKHDADASQRLFSRTFHATVTELMAVQTTNGIILEETE